MGPITLSKTEIIQLIKKIKGDNWELVEYKIKSVSEEPIGFLGSHFNLITKICEKNKETVETLRFFIKTLPGVGNHAQYVEEIGAFKKEGLLQRKLLPRMLQSTSFLKYPWTANCHIVKDNLLLFDDLSTSGYKIAEGKEILDLDHCIAALNTLADFHASSLIWEESNRVENKTNFLISDIYPEATTEVCYIHETGHTRNNWLKSVTDATAHLCKLVGRENETDRVRGIIKNALTLVGPSKKWRNVLSHADLWSNNFMFKYNKDGSIDHCVLVDYQLARYAPAALDLICCIHLISTLKLRTDFLPLLIDTYYERLTDVLCGAGLKIEHILPRQEIIDGCRLYKQVGVIETIFYGTTIWIPSSISTGILNDTDKCLDITTGDRTKVVEMSFRSDEFFRQQMTDLIGELLDQPIYIDNNHIEV